MSTRPHPFAGKNGQEQRLPWRGDAGRRDGRGRKTPCGSPPCKRPCGLGPLPSEACACGGDEWERSSGQLRRPETCLLPCVAMKITRLLAMTLLLVLCGVFASGCGSSSGSGGSDDPAALIPAGAPVYIEGVVRRAGKVRTDLEGGAQEDPAHRRPGREDHPAAQRHRQGREGHLQGRRRSVARRPRRRRRHRSTQGPGRRLRGRHRLQGRRQGRQDLANRRATSSSAPTRASTTASTARTTPRRRSSITASWSGPRPA